MPRTKIFLMIIIKVKIENLEEKNIRFMDRKGLSKHKIMRGMQKPSSELHKHFKLLWQLTARVYSSKTPEQKHLKT